MPLIFKILPLLCLTLSIIAFFLLRFVIYQERLVKRYDRATGLVTSDDAQHDRELWHVYLISSVGFIVIRSGLLTSSTLKTLKHTLRFSGVRGSRALGLFVGAKILLFVFCPFFTYIIFRSLPLSRLSFVFCILVSSIFGILVPDLVINYRRKRFIKRLEAGLADTLDMMVICADAGLSLEAALSRVAHEIRGTHNAVSDELTLTSQEMRIGSDVREALTGLGARTGLASLKRLGSTLIQTLQYGTPLTHALRILSAELRQEQLTRFEERAARLPVLLTVPMIVFILPCVFLVVGGPAILKVMGAFASR